MDGGWKSTATGLASLPVARATTTTCRRCSTVAQLHGPPQERAAHARTGAWARCSADSGVKVFQIETTLNNDTFGTVRPDVGAPEARVGVDRQATGPRSSRMKAGLDRMPIEGPPQDLQQRGWRPTASPRCRPARSRPCTRSRPQNVFAQQLVPIEGQTDILTMGLPYICPYNVNSVMNPILVMCLGLGYFFNMYRGQAARARGRRADHEPPHAVGVPPGAPPELHRLLRAGARRDHRPGGDRGPLREAVRRGRVVPPPLPHELRLPRRPPVLHVVLGLPRHGSTSAR